MRNVNLSTNPSGLMSRGTPVPLLGVRVDAEIRDFCSRVTLTQRYRNDESSPIEAVYVFSLDESAAVSKFEVLVGDTLIVGQVKDRVEAFEMYDDALARGDGAYLLDQEKPTSSPRASETSSRARKFSSRSRT